MHGKRNAEASPPARSKEIQRLPSAAAEPIPRRCSCLPPQQPQQRRLLGTPEESRHSLTLLGMTIPVLVSRCDPLIDNLCIDTLYIGSHGEARSAAGDAGHADPEDAQPSAAARI